MVVGGGFFLKIAKVVTIILILASSIYVISTISNDSTKVSGVDYPAVSDNPKVTTEKIPYKQEIHNYEGLYSYIGMKSSEIKKLLGDPTRIDNSSYDYDWWIYNSDPQNYIQVGIENDKVVTVYGTGNSVNVTPFQIGQPIEELISKGLIKQTVSLTVDKNPYRFELSEEDMVARPLLAMGDVYVQLYVDTFTKKISSIRFLDNVTLVKQRPYELVYRGELLSAKEVKQDEWKEIEKGNTAQILDITNVLRIRHGLSPLKWDAKTAQVAYLHSKDMSTAGYFDHNSPTYGGLADRLAKGEVIYQVAGENIAAKYVDGIAAVEGWLNSEGHRETLLNEEYNYLGVGVYEKFYTQNFILKWE
ncbi:CAP domain-containing protein [Fredinandcohnia humi]